MITSQIATGITILSLLIILLRFKRIKRVFTEGERISAVITEINFPKDRGRVEYEYTYNGVKYSLGNAIMKNRETLKFEEGNTIEIVIDRKKPSRSYIVSLFRE